MKPPISNNPEELQSSEVKVLFDLLNEHRDKKDQEFLFIPTGSTIKCINNNTFMLVPYTSGKDQTLPDYYCVAICVLLENADNKIIAKLGVDAKNILEPLRIQLIQDNYTLEALKVICDSATQILTPNNGLELPTSSTVH